MTEQAPARPPAVRTRPGCAVLLGLLLIPLNVYWVQYTECATGVAMATMASIFFSAVVSLLVVVLLNALVAKLRPPWALSAADLLLAYAMVSVATAVAGHDQLEVLVNTIAAPFYHATPENRWEALFGRYLDRPAMLTDPALLRAFWEGHRQPTLPTVLTALRPFVFWLGFCVALYGTMLCLSLIFRPRWSEAERLSYPLLQIPLEVARGPVGVFRSRVFWCGCAVAGAIDLLNGIHALVPAVPGLRVTAFDLQRQFTSPTARALGYLPISAYPWVIGLGFLLPVEYLLSCSLFFWVWKLELLYGALYARGSRFPYVAEQSVGAYLGIALFSLWVARAHLKQVWNAMLHGLEVRGVPRWALPGALLGTGVCLAYGHLLGMGWPVALVYFVLYFTVALAIARVRAEMGVPAHDLLSAGPDRALVALGGSSALGPHNLTAFATLMWLNRAQRSHPMPHQLEGLELGARSGARPTPVAAVLALAALAGYGCGFVTMLYLGFRHGMSTVPTDASYFGFDAWRLLASQLDVPRPTDPNVAAAMGVGALITIGLLRLRTLFAGWPLHPIGYAVTSYFFGAILWLPLLLAYLLKSAVLRFGGLKVYRAWQPFFLGLILGDFTVGGMWSLVGVLTGWPTYRFWAY